MVVMMTMFALLPTGESFRPVFAGHAPWNLYNTGMLLHRVFHAAS
jgi:hypothetical protein